MNLKQWWSERRRRINRKHYEVGFCWAVGQLFLEQETPQTIYAQCSSTLTFVGYLDAFDRGALAALKMMRERGLFL